MALLVAQLELNNISITVHVARDQEYVHRNDQEQNRLLPQTDPIANIVIDKESKN